MLNVMLNEWNNNMTCIVGLETKKGIILGGDAAGVANGTIYSTRIKKVFKVSDMLIGYTDSFRMGQLFQYQLKVKPKKSKMPDIVYLTTIVMDKMRKVLSKGGFKSGGLDSGGNFLLGYNGVLYEICADFQVNSSRDGYNAVGSGYPYALGSLHSSQGLPPQRRIEMALEAATHHCTSVCKPYLIVKSWK